jgi:hypothetical protein
LQRPLNPFVASSILTWYTNKIKGLQLNSGKPFLLGICWGHELFKRLPQEGGQHLDFLQAFAILERLGMSAAKAAPDKIQPSPTIFPPSVPK